MGVDIAICFNVAVDVEIWMVGCDVGISVVLMVSAGVDVGP